jgi:hypothetical protein
MAKVDIFNVLPRFAWSTKAEKPRLRGQLEIPQAENTLGVQRSLRNRRGLMQFCFTGFAVSGEAPVATWGRSSSLTDTLHLAEVDQCLDGTGGNNLESSSSTLTAKVASTERQTTYSWWTQMKVFART